MADEEEDQESVELSLHNAGEALRRAREQKNLSIEDIAKTTRIPQRHLSSIEASDFGALPGRTYAIGFAKSYARAVGISDASIGSQLREEMDEQGHGAYQPETSGYSPANPTSIPPKALAWTAAGIGAIILVGYLVWRTLFLSPDAFNSTDTGTELAGQGDDTQIVQNAASEDAAPAPSQTGTVMLTARENVWLKIYNEDGERLFEKEMAQGEQYTVPADAKGPQILTGRPDALTVTIDGQTVPDLGTAERTISDVGISAAALLARSERGAPANNDEPGQTISN
ncbi:hypothetical protein MNBD_ALPHA04-846 [hydrothermal vent metagenome]|uniref:HTH cro/C1-type domain-containing protein n=1 Tax=hydrothermal vent metagenome TaxID=652676 RepID=A0A3B0SGX5_9ZZZZ